ncbi:hypothetical protein QJS04_geneDACA005979 [Acorus gramineus]|uniref:Autophagy-related protein 27 n=1 Tax=Acorus gramineus TaxID=55184 RepID=A0AAV9B537_ACOGR|nr:hypothetical protein QJS04_geneDACA005979 [Acorus gramineus]
MTKQCLTWALLIVSVFLCPKTIRSESGSCDLSVIRGNSMYNFSLPSPRPNYPHGALSEDGFYKLALNGTFLWFQLCDQMIFNHDPPRCVGCQGCGGPLHCGMKCNALVAEKIEGYYVCTTIGQHSTTNIAPIDEKDLRKGVVVKMSASNPTNKCSLSVSVFCDPSRTHGLHSIDKHGTCDYVTELWHPSGCANIISIHGKGLGWFGTLIITILCLFGGYLLAGSAYRYFFLGIRGLDVIPNMEFWLHLLEILQSFLGSLVGRWRRRSQDSQNPYRPVRR